MKYSRVPSQKGAGYQVEGITYSTLVPTVDAPFEPKELLEPTQDSLWTEPISVAVSVEDEAKVPLFNQKPARWD